MNKDLELLRNDMVIAFNVFKRTPQDDLRSRKELWEDYVLKREKFLKLDAKIHGYKYTSLDQMIVISGPYT